MTFLIVWNRKQRRSLVVKGGSKVGRRRILGRDQWRGDSAGGPSTVSVMKRKRERERREGNHMYYLC